MSSDLIFHIVSKRKWRETNKGGFYRPENEHDESRIECVMPENLNDYLNEHFRGHKNLLILVIDQFRLANRAKYDKEKHTAVITGGINIDAILDKIRIDCGKDGRFDLSVSKE